VSLPAGLVIAAIMPTVPRPEYYGNPSGLTEDIDVVRGIYAAFAARDLDGALEFIAPGCEIHLEGTARAVGRTGPYVGHTGLREYFADVERVWDELQIHATDFRTVPGSVIVLGHVSARADGKAIRRTAVWTWRVDDGRATHLRVSDMGSAE
jgi:ketosteroid isomerase-like protein